VALKKKFLLRLDSALYASLERWAADDLRSINAQMEFLLHNAVKTAGRLATVRPETRGAGTEEEDHGDHDQDTERST
jgi:hypothetical protein